MIRAKEKDLHLEIILFGHGRLVVHGRDAAEVGAVIPADVYLLDFAVSKERAGVCPTTLHAKVELENVGHIVGICAPAIWVIAKVAKLPNLERASDRLSPQNYQN